MTAATVPVVAANRFPALVHDPAGQLLARAARAVITCPDGDHPARLMVWLQPGDPAVDTSIDLDASTIGRARSAWQVTTPGGVYRVEQSGGCGCGSRLKRFEPFTPMLMGRLP